MVNSINNRPNWRPKGYYFNLGHMYLHDQQLGFGVKSSNSALTYYSATCADPESFVGGGPTLTTFLFFCV